LGNHRRTNHSITQPARHGQNGQNEMVAPRIDTIVCKMSQLISSVGDCVKANLPALVVGSPGIGKSDGLRQIAKAHNYDRFIDIRAAQMDPVDFGGVPYIENKQTHWADAMLIPHDDVRTFVLFDEITSASPAVQAAFYRVILERQIGSYSIPDTVYMCGAGNLETDRAVVTRQSTALASRFIHHTLTVDVDDWCRWALTDGIAAEVIAFIRFRPELLHQFGPDKNKEKAFPCPRTWHFVSKLVNIQPNPATEYITYTGTVGEGAAAEFLAFLKIWRTLPNPDAILLNPAAAAVPTDPATLYAICGALASMATINTFDRIAEYAERLPAEFSVLLVSNARNTRPEIQNTPGFTKWSINHSSDVLL